MTGVFLGHDWGLSPLPPTSPQHLIIPVGKTEESVFYPSLRCLKSSSSLYSSAALGKSALTAPPVKSHRLPSDTITWGNDTLGKLVPIYCHLNARLSLGGLVAGASLSLCDFSTEGPYISARQALQAYLSAVLQRETDNYYL